MNPNQETTLAIKGLFGWAAWGCAIPAWLVGGFELSGAAGDQEATENQLTDSLEGRTARSPGAIRRFPEFHWLAKTF